MTLLKNLPKRNVIWFLTFFSLTSCQESFDNRLYREAKEFTVNHCPQEPEKGTRLDSTTYDIASRTYTQWYGLETFNEQVISENGLSTLVWHIEIDFFLVKPLIKLFVKAVVLSD